jgi:hypothetical protein
VFIPKYLRSCAVLITALFLSACEKKSSVDEKIFTSETEDIENSVKEQSHSLSKVADRGGVEIVTDEISHFHLSEAAKAYVGRYTVRMDCSDRFARCTEGQADLIVTLLEDGTARRSIVHTGNVSFDANWYYRKDYWSYDEINHQIVLHRDTGVEFFYNISKEHHLIMDLEKILYGTELNREYFAQSNPPPAKAYVLKKVS